MKFLKKLWALLFGKKEQAPVVKVGYTADLIVDESELAPIVEPEKAHIVEIPEVVAEKIAGEAVVVKKKKYIKKKK